MEEGRHYDVVIVGAGISGISAAYHLKQLCPKLTFTMFEGRGNIGGELWMLAAAAAACCWLRCCFRQTRMCDTIGVLFVEVCLILCVLSHADVLT